MNIIVWIREMINKMSCINNNTNIDESNSTISEITPESEESNTNNVDDSKLEIEVPVDDSNLEREVPLDGNNLEYCNKNCGTGECKCDIN
tara:strand:+ start:23472 stop:23741 length:270 start_codon:yes stop_codon:yes gene_type:complete